jgi:hypothetical protein
MHSAIPRFHKEPLIHRPFPIVFTVADKALFGGSLPMNAKTVISVTENPNLLQSFYYLKRRWDGERCFVEELAQPGTLPFLDSGGYTLQRNDDLSAEDIEAYVKEYVSFCLKYGNRFVCYANLDIMRNDPEANYRMQKRLEGEGIYPFPVEHGDGSLDCFRRYLNEGYKFIGISRPKEQGRNRAAVMRSFDRLFKTAIKYDVAIHGFGVTDIEILLRYPFFSVDSSSAIFATRHGRVFTVNEKGQVKVIAVSKHPNTAAKSRQEGLEAAQSQIDSHGFNFDETRYYGTDKVRKRLAWNQRFLWNHYFMSHLEKFGVRVTGGRP